MNSFKTSCLDTEREYIGLTRLETLFKVDLKVIRMIRSKNFSFGFAEDVSEFIILARDI